MSKRSTILLVLLGMLGLGTAAQADLMPMSPSAGGCQPLPQASVAEPVTGENPLAPFGGGTISDLPSLPVRPVSAANGEAGPLGETQDVPILTDGQNSFSLCLYTLLGLGLCRSLPLVKKVSFGYIPQWYHDGGPVQVGHSFVISPDCLSHAAVCCFAPPQGTADCHIPRYLFGTVVAHWRNSQFTPAVLAARAPPLCSC